LSPDFLHKPIISAADPDPGSGAFLIPGSGMGKKRIRIIFPMVSLETIFWVKILKFFDADPGWKKFESGINARIRNTAYHPLK
jgi:hypothetical protein